MCNRMAIINDGKVLAAGTVKGLKKNQNETLEDVFIRLVGRSIEDVEAQDIDAEKDGASEEE